jgi:RHS repeat-associated protein
MKIVSGQYPSPPGILISHYNVNSSVYIVFALSGFGLSSEGHTVPAARGEGEESAGGVRVAMSEKINSGLENIRYFVTDHLGSTTKMINADGTTFPDDDNYEIMYTSWGSDQPDIPDLGTRFKYTGQREAETGLYFYNARWYDPKTGRFIQADTIISNPANPLDWDRYAYTINNPVNYLDPSGHCVVIEEGGECYTEKLEGIDYPTRLDRGRLSTNIHCIGKFCASALDLYNYYFELFSNKKGFWWRAYGQDFDGFTIWDLLSLLVAQEGEATVAWAEYMAEAAVRWFYARVNEEPPLNEDSIYGMLDWFTSYMQSTDGLVFNHGIPEMYGGGDISAYQTFSIVGASFKNPPSSWAQGYQKDRPFGWGNAYGYRNPYATSMFRNHPALMFVFIDDGDDSFFIPAGCAVRAWLDQSLGTHECDGITIQL